MKSIITLSIVLSSGQFFDGLAYGGRNIGLTQSSEEEVQSRLQRFYSNKVESSLMMERQPKYSVKTGKVIAPNPILKFKVGHEPKNKLEDLAQIKSTKNYQEKYCKNVLQKYFPEIECGHVESSISQWSGLQANDRVERLAWTWMDSIENRLDKLPIHGDTNISLWSDDYWRIKWGGTSYRYADGVRYKTYEEAVSAYLQPKEWASVIGILPPVELSNKIKGWSPAEKYDLAVGDLQFSLTNEQKSEGRSMLGPDGDVESWMGICHGWAAAAILVPKSTRSTNIIGAQGVNLTLYPHDVRALASLAWANGTHSSNFVGGRCNTKGAKTFANGRLMDQNCFDTNPATFHLALSNLLGREKASFVMDSAFDYEVWNQPIYSYDFVYFNPLEPAKQSKNWREVAVAYDEKFKRADRFQKPLTRGQFDVNTQKYNDSRVQTVVGVISKIVYLGEVLPRIGDDARDEELIRVNYTYDLEVTEEQGELTISGGEWHSNAHPDFLWVPRKGSVAQMAFDKEKYKYSGEQAAPEKLSALARSASRYGYPLCGVLSELLKRTIGSGSYNCPAE